jgi:hypothetical protein
LAKLPSEDQIRKRNQKIRTYLSNPEPCEFPEMTPDIIEPRITYTRAEQNKTKVNGKAKKERCAACVVVVVVYVTPSLSFF